MLMPLPESELIILPTPRGALAPTMAFTVRWRRSTRAQRVSMRVCPRDGAVMMTLPPGEGRRAGLALLKEHGGWVMDRLAALAPATPFTPGVLVPIGGVKHRLRHDPDGQGGAFLHRCALVVTGPLETFRRRTMDFMRAEARHRITALVSPHATALGVTHGPIRVKDTRSRWGSCAPDGTLAFSWRLVMAPERVMNYVVAHEVTHLKELNHSKHFWAQLARLDTRREEAVAWLTTEGPGLLRIG